MLKKLGAPVHLRGYKQMRDLIAIVYENKNYKKIKYSDLYRELGEKYGVKAADRTLRYFVYYIFSQKNNNEYIDKIFGYRSTEPSLIEFVEAIVDELKLQ